MGRLRYVVEQTFALFHQFKRLAVRWERRTELYDAFVSIACGPHLRAAPQASTTVIVLGAPSDAYGVLPLAHPV